jgi:ABC-type glutathione transport system ATPase component
MRAMVPPEPVGSSSPTIHSRIRRAAGLGDLHYEMRFSCLFTTHDPATVEYLCDQVAVMAEPG